MTLEGKGAVVSGVGGQFPVGEVPNRGKGTTDFFETPDEPGGEGPGSAQGQEAGIHGAPSVFVGGACRCRFFAPHLVKMFFDDGVGFQAKGFLDIKKGPADIFF